MSIVGFKTLRLSKAVSREATREEKFLSCVLKSSTLWLLTMVRSKMCAKKYSSSKTLRFNKWAVFK